MGMKSEGGSDRAYWVFVAAVFAVLAIAVNYPVLLGKAPFPRDMVMQFPAWDEVPREEPRQTVADVGDVSEYFYLFHALAGDAVRSGQSPWWNPYIIWGVPYQAEPQSSLFYPLMFPYYVFPPPVAWTINILARLFIAGFFTALLVRSIGGSRTGSVISGIVFAFCGFTTVFQGQAMGDAVVWLPLIFYAVYRLSRHASPNTIALTAFAFGMPVLAGHPETAGHLIAAGILAATVIWVFPVDPDSRPFRPAFVLGFALAGVFSLGLTAVQLVPTLEWIGLSMRSLEEIWPPLDWHHALGFFSRDILHGPNSAGVLIPQGAAYAGMTTLLAASVSVLHRNRRCVLWFLVLIFIGVTGSFGFEPVKWILLHIPVIKGLRNERLILFADFGLAVLAGLGISVLQTLDSASPRSRRVIAAILMLAVFTFAYFCIYNLWEATQFRVEFTRRPSFSRAMLFAGLLLLGWRLLGRLPVKAFSLLACLLVAFDLLSYAHGYIGFTRPAEIYPSAPLFDFLRSQAPLSTFRVARIGGYTYGANGAAMYGLHSANGYEVSLFPSTKNFALDFGEDYSNAVELVTEKVLAAKDRRLDMLNLRYLAVTKSTPAYGQFMAVPERFPQVFDRGNVAVFENKSVLPRAFLVSAKGARVSEKNQEQLDWIRDPGFDPTKSVTLSRLPEEFLSLPAVASNAPAGLVEMVDSTVSSYRFRVHSTEPSVLVVSQNFYPGWTAEVNGRPASTFPADYALSGIALPAGDLDVTFEFRPVSLKIGAVISTVSLGVFFTLLVYHRRARVPGTSATSS